MERLWRPWRINYIKDIENIREEGCIFCTKPQQGDDEKSLILHRGKTAFIMLNLFPYNTGHLMVSPYRHQGDIADLTEEERNEMMELAVLSVRVIREAMRPQAFNLGMNIGKTAGAGFHEHVHMHIVPRWEGDTNFMPVVAGAKVMPESVQENYKRLKEALRRLDEGK
jgi:ATP adenylyltransferase